MSIARVRRLFAPDLARLLAPVESEPVKHFARGGVVLLAEDFWRGPALDIVAADARAGTLTLR